MSDFGINFRETSGYVTDPANTTYLLHEAYPVTRGGFTFGITANLALTVGRDRNAGIDPRLAGLNQNSTATKSEYRLDLTAGNYDIQVAGGDAMYTGSIDIEVLNDASSLFAISASTSGSDRFIDALGALHPTSWVPSSVEAKTNQSVSSGILRWKTGNGTSTSTGIAHLRVTSSVVATPLGFGKITSNRKYFLPSEAALVLAALESKRRLSRRRFFQWLPGAFWRK